MYHYSLFTQPFIRITEHCSLARKRLAIEMGMGTDLHGMDYTKAAVRGLRDALWHNSLSVVPALVLPYGKATVKPVKGGLDVPNDDGSNTTVIASVAVVVYLDVEVA